MVRVRYSVLWIRCAGLACVVTGHLLCCHRSNVIIITLIIRDVRREIWPIGDVLSLVLFLSSYSWHACMGYAWKFNVILVGMLVFTRGRLGWSRGGFSGRYEYWVLFLLRTEYYLLEFQFPVSLKRLTLYWASSLRYIPYRRTEDEVEPSLFALRDYKECSRLLSHIFSRHLIDQQSPQ